MKKLGLSLVVCAGFIILAGITSRAVFAAYGNNGLCNPQDTGNPSPGSPNDRDNFPYGFLCGGDKDDTQNAVLRVWNGSTEITNGSIQPLLSNSEIHFSGGYNQSSGPKRNGNNPASEVLVWMTIDGADQLVNDATISNVSGGGSNSLRCPGSATPGQPGVVYNFRDLRAPGNTNYNIAGGDNVDASPAPYNPSNNEGKEDCGLSGKMVYWANANSGTGNYNFDLRLNNGRTGSVCVRVNISVRFGSSDPYFPPSSVLSPPANASEQSGQASVARNIAKQSERRCFNVQNFNTPEGAFDVIACEGYTIRGHDPDHPGTAVFYRVANVSTSNISDSGITSQFDTTFRTKPLVNGETYKGQILDPDSGTWFDVGQDTASCSTTDTRPTYTLDVYCSGVVVRNIDDGNIKAPPKGQGVHMFAKFWHRYVDAAGTETWGPVNGSMDPNARDYDVDDRSGDVFIAWPWGAEDGQNSGWGMWIGDYNVNLNGDDDMNSAQYKYSAEVEGGCYQATCTIDIGENFTGAPTNGVWGGRDFNVTATFSNPDARIPVFVYNFGSWTLAGASSVQNNALSDDLGGNQLAATDGGGTYDFAPVDFFPGGGSINPGTSAQRTFPLGASTTINSGRVELYPDYYGRMGIGPSCGEDVNVYNEFRINPTSSSSLDDPENPTRADYTSRALQDAGLNTGTTIPGSSDRRLYWKRGGVFQGNLDGVYAQSGVRYGDSGFMANFWTKSGATPAWQAGDEICSEMVVRPHHGWIGPGDDVRADVPSWLDDDCEVVVNHPFIRSYGGDVVGGGSGVQGYIRDYQGSGAGSGVEFAAIALDSTDIRGFSSALFRISTPAPAGGLAFANNNGAGGGVDQAFGGKFGTRVQLQPNYVDDLRYDTDSAYVDGPVKTYTGVSTDSLASDKQTQATPTGGVLTLTGSNSYTGNKTLFVTGDVVITGEGIKYADWTSTGAIPSFALIVKGNIYISSSVTQLDGLYVAQNGGNGKIFTCTNEYSFFAAADLYNNCSVNKLQVNGALVADSKVMFLRAKNTLRDITVDTPKVPAGGGSPSIGNVTYSKAGATRSGCLMMVEPSDPNWNAGGGNTTVNDNYLCYDRPSDRPTMNLTWSYVGIPAGFAAADCVSFNNNREDLAHTWSDNFLCQPAGANLQLELRTNTTVPVGKTCVNIVEDMWAAAEPVINPWGNNRMNLCYRTATAGAPAIDAVYNKEIFGADNAAESVYLRPEMYLGRWPGLKPEGSQANGKYDSLVTLPPIL